MVADDAHLEEHHPCHTTVIYQNNKCHVNYQNISPVITESLNRFSQNVDYLKHGVSCCHGNSTAPVTTSRCPRSFLSEK